jgi:hypothetical protein
VVRLIAKKPLENIYSGGHGFSRKLSMTEITVKSETS